MLSKENSELAMTSILDGLIHYKDIVPQSQALHGHISHYCIATQCRYGGYMSDPKTHLLPIREFVPSIMIRLSLPLVAGSSTDPGPQRHIALIES